MPTGLCEDTEPVCSVAMASLYKSVCLSPRPGEHESASISSRKQLCPSGCLSEYKADLGDPIFGDPPIPQLDRPLWFSKAETSPIW